MLTRSLALTVIWLLLSVVPTMLWGTRLRRRSGLRSMSWLVFVILLGDLWALLTFGNSLEVATLSLVAFLSGIWWIRRLPNWNSLGQTAWTMSVLSIVFYLIYSFALTAFSPLHPLGFLLSCVLFALEVFALGLSLSFTYETLDVCTRVYWERTFRPSKPLPGYTPKISLHVPAYNEPPEVVEKTLRTLAKLDYPNFEVLLVDNNTPDETTWRPLEAVCRQLGPNFKCLHLDKWPGYKSGALNFALTQTDPEAEIVGIIDADYEVDGSYLNQTVPYFKEPNVGFLQTPQDYREYKGNSFLEGCYDAYKYFFDVSMPSRNEHNAIIFGGTMGLIRNSVLQEIGGWDEWCITEDAEASLRILKRGYQSIFINHAYGHGIMPLNFEGLKKQRFRWCFGGIQILRKHWESLMPWAHWVDPDNHLTYAQRYHYLAGSLQWFNELATLVFTGLLLLSSVAMLLGWGIGVRPLAGAIIAIPLIGIILGLWRFLWALRYARKLKWPQALRSMGSFFSLSWVVTLGVIQGLIQPTGVFLRTPKSKTRSGLMRALRVTKWETTLGVLCLTVCLLLVVKLSSLTVLAIALLLLWQATIYLTSPAYSLLSLHGETAPVLLSSRGDIQGHSTTENRASGWALALSVLLIFMVGLLILLPTPSTKPVYSQFQPAELQPQEIFGAPALPTPTNIPKSPSTPTSTPTPQLPLSTQTPAQHPFYTQAPTHRPLSTQVSTKRPLPKPTPTPPPPPTQAPTQHPLPTQAPIQRPRPTQAPTQRPLPTQAPTQHPRPTQAPTQHPQPTQAPTQHPQPTKNPAQPPRPTQAPTPPVHP